MCVWKWFQNKDLSIALPLNDMFYNCCNKSMTCIWNISCITQVLLTPGKHSLRLANENQQKIKKLKKLPSRLGEWEQGLVHEDEKMLLILTAQTPSRSHPMFWERKELFMRVKYFLFNFLEFTFQIFFYTQGRAQELGSYINSTKI